MSTGYLVLELGYPFVSRDGCCSEDLNHSKPFGVAEGIAATILDLGNDPAKHHLAGVVVAVAWAVLCLGGHNGLASVGVVDSDIIAHEMDLGSLGLIRGL